MPVSDYWTINTTAKTVTHSSGTTTDTVLDFFKWLANTFAAAGYMDDEFPMLSDTPTVYRFVNGWAFGAPTTDYKYLTGGAITSSDATAVWANLYSIGEQFRSSQIYIVQAGAELTPWWSTGNIDVLLNIKTSGSLIDGGNVTVMSRDSDCLYDHNIVDLQLGGRNPVGINTFEDLNYKTTGDLYLTVASVTGFDIGEYAYGNTSTASGRIQYVDTVNSRLYLCQVEGTFQTSETIYERATRTGANTATTTNNASTAFTNVIKGYTDVKYAFVQRKFTGGTTGSPVFQFGETITQAVSGWTGRFIADVANIIYAENTSGTPNGTSQLTGSTSGAHYTPTATSAQATVSLDLGNGEGVQPYGAYVDCAGRSVLQSYQYLKYITSHNSGVTVNADNGEEYRSVISGTYSDVKQAPFGTFAGGKFFGARGVWIANMIATDSQNYILTDSNNVARTPPVTVPITITNTISGDRVAVFRALDANGTIDKTYISSHASSNSTGSTTWTATAAIPIDTPTTGFVHLRIASTQVEERIAYTGWSGSAFTLSLAHSGGYGTGDSAYVPYIDGTASGTSMSTTVKFDQTRNISTRVRIKGLQPYTNNTTQLDSTGYSASVTRIDDTIVV